MIIVFKFGHKYYSGGYFLGYSDPLGGDKGLFFPQLEILKHKYRTVKQISIFFIVQILE